MYKLLVGIDVSKERFSAAGIDSGGKEAFSRAYTMDSKGFEELLKAVRSHCEEDSKVLMAMESTGCYHINLFSFLSSQGIGYIGCESLADIQLCEAVFAEDKDR